MKNMKVKEMTTLGILCAFAIVINLLAIFPLVPAVPWLTYDPKDIIIVIGGFIYGPFASFMMSAICSIIEIMIKGGTVLDVLMDVIATCSFACVAAAIYKKKHTKQGAMFGGWCYLYDDCYGILELYCHTNLLWYAKGSRCCFIASRNYSF